MKKKFYYIMTVWVVIFAVSLVASCASDTPDDLSVYTYTSDQIAQIEEMKDDYGAVVDIPYSSSTPLPPVDAVKELIEFVSFVQNAPKRVKQSGKNQMTFTTRASILTRQLGTRAGGLETYSGMRSGRYSNNIYADIDWTVKWSDYSTTSGVVTGEIDHISPKTLQGNWNISLGAFSYQYLGGGRLSYKFEMHAHYQSYSNQPQKFYFGDEIGL
jgi:hypothetical protein